MTRFCLVAFSIPWAMVVLLGGRPRHGGRFDGPAGDVCRSAPPVQFRPAVGLERHAQRRTGPRHHARPGRAEREAGIRPSARRADDALSLGRLVPPLEGRARGGQAPGHERLDLRRGFLPVGLCRRTGARRDAGVARPRPVLYRSQTAGKSGRRRAGRLPPRRRRLRRRHRPGPRRRDAARRQVSGRCRSPRPQFSLARREVVCRSALSGRDAEVPGDHPRVPTSARSATSSASACPALFATSRT